MCNLVVSKAFQVLSDPDKKRIFDQTGSDPESRGAGMSGFSGFSGARAAGGNGGAAGGPVFDDFAEEIFRSFFGPNVGMGGGGPAFQGFGPFGPNVRIHTFGTPFGAGVPRGAAGGGGNGRGPGARRGANEEEPQDFMSNLVRLLPLLLLFITPLLSSLFDTSSSGYSRPTRFEFTPSPPYTERRTTSQHNIPYFVNPSDIQSMTSSNLRKLDHRAEISYIRSLRDLCSQEYEYKQQQIMNSHGWFTVDKDALAEAENIKLPHCEKIDELGISR